MADEGEAAVRDDREDARESLRDEVDAPHVRIWKVGGGGVSVRHDGADHDEDGHQDDARDTVLCVSIRVRGNKVGVVNGCGFWE